MNSHKRVQFGMKKADHKRFLLAFRAEEFGIRDPMAGAKAQGFTFEVDKTEIQVGFRGAPVAVYGLDWHNGAMALIFLRPLSEQTCKQFAQVFKGMREAASQGARMMNADQRDMEARGKALQGRATARGSLFEIEKRDAIRACLGANAIPMGIRIEMNADPWNADRDIYCRVVLRSEAFKENDYAIGSFALHERNATSRGYSPVSDALLAQILTEGLAAYRAAADFAAPDAPPSAPLPASVISAWEAAAIEEARRQSQEPSGSSRLLFGEVFLEEDGILIRATSARVVAERSGVVLARMDRNKTGECLIVDPDFSPQKRAHLATLMRNAIRATLGSPNEERDLDQQIANAVSSIDMGYGS